MAKMNTLKTAIAMMAIASAALVTGSPAYARINSLSEADGAHGLYCYSLQNRLDAIVKRMTDLRKAGNVGSEYNALLKEGRGIMATWKNSCQRAHGSPFYGPPPPELSGYTLPRIPTTNDKATPAPAQPGGAKRLNDVLDLPMKLQR